MGKGYTHEGAKTRRQESWGLATAIRGNENKLRSGVFGFEHKVLT